MMIAQIMIIAFLIAASIAVPHRIGVYALEGEAHFLEALCYGYMAIGMLTIPPLLILLMWFG
jgi:hypothetical protein